MHPFNTESKHLMLHYRNRLNRKRFDMSHFRRSKALFIILILFIFYAPSVISESIDGNASSIRQQNAPVHLHFFWSHRCPHCLEAKPVVEAMAETYSWLQLHSYDLLNNRDHVNRYIEMSGQLGMDANSVPGFIFCDQMMVGFSRDELEKRLMACHKNLTYTEEAFELPVLGKVHYRDFSLPVFTLIIAALDAFNPCAFFVLFFLLSLIVHQRSRMRIAAIGGTFVLFSGLMYFLFMAAWLNLFLLTGQLTFITGIAGSIAIVAGLVNVKDYFYFKQGVSLSITDSAKPRLYQRMRSLVQAGKWPAMLAASAILAVTANSYELLCTAGLPMIYTRVLTLNELSSHQYYLYLVFYNVIYIIPLLMIVSIFTYTLGSKKLSESEGRLLKLLSGAMMLGLGGILLFAPDLLNHLYTSLAVIVTAVGLTVIFAVIDQYRRKVS